VRCSEEVQLVGGGLGTDECAEGADQVKFDSRSSRLATTVDYDSYKKSRWGTERTGQEEGWLRQRGEGWQFGFRSTWRMGRRAQGGGAAQAALQGLQIDGPSDRARELTYISGPQDFPRESPNQMQISDRVTYEGLGASRICGRS
jgi:hypothetical protein